MEDSAPMRREQQWFNRRAIKKVIRDWEKSCVSLGVFHRQRLQH